MFTRSSFRFFSALSLCLVACSGESPSPKGADPDPGVEQPAEGSFELSVANVKVPIVQGDEASLEVRVTRKDGFEGAVEITASDLPAGVTLEPRVIPADAASVTLELRAAGEAPHSLPSRVELRGTADEVESSVALTVTVCGHPGALDTSFAGGRAIVPAGTGEDYANAVALTANGKVLVAGRRGENLGDFALVRLERDGSLDTSFGEEGVVATAIGTSTETAYAIAVQKDGKIVVAGSTMTDASGLDFALVRYLADGSLDESFGNGGKVVTRLSDDSDTAYAILLQEDGKIVLGGESSQGTSQSGLDFALVRYLEDGSLDESFGDEGRVVTAVKSSSGRDVIYALAGQEIDGEERIVAVGGEGDFSLARYRADGRLDTSFGDGGKLSGVLGSTIGAARAVQVDKDGNVLVAGHQSHDFALVRFTRSGELDPSFGEGEPVITQVSETNWDEAQSLALDAEGRIVVGGWAYEGNSSSGNFALARYEDDGSLDETFGDEGIVITQVAVASKDDLASALLLQADDRIPAVRVVVAGSANDSNHDFAVTRYWQ